jgi:hypothetical protein
MIYVEVGSGAMTYIPSFIKTGSGIQKLIPGTLDTHTHRGHRINLLSLFYKIKVGLCDLHPICASVYHPIPNFEWLNQYLLNWYVYNDT